MSITANINIDFVNSVFKEMQGQQQLLDQLKGLENAGISYKLGEDRTTMVLSKCMFTDKACQFLVKRLDSNAPKHEKLAAILWMVVGAIKFGMYLARKEHQTGGFAG